MSDKRINAKPYPTVAPAPLPRPDFTPQAPWYTPSGRPTIASRESTSSLGAYGSLLRYVGITSEKRLNFKPGDYYTEKMKSHPGVSETRKSVQDALATYCRTDCNPEPSVGSGQTSYSLGERGFFGQVWDGIKTVFGAITFGAVGSDPDYGTVGSFSTSSNVKTGKIDCENGTAEANFSVSNRMSASSNTRFSYKGIFGITSILPDNPLGETGPLGTVEQNWEWSERLSFDKNPQCSSTSQEKLSK
jgi:hypothetical protein